MPWMMMTSAWNLLMSLPTTLNTLTLTEEHLSRGRTLRDMNLPEGSLVMMIRRGDRYIVPNGTRRLHPGDRLLIIRETEPDSARLLALRLHFLKRGLTPRNQSQDFTEEELLKINKFCVVAL